MDRHAKEGYSVFAIGDDRTDEDLFESLGKDSISIKVGHDRKTFANFYVDEQSKVDTILEKLLI